MHVKDKMTALINLLLWILKHLNILKFSLNEIKRTTIHNINFSLNKTIIHFVYCIIYFIIHIYFQCLYDSNLYQFFSIFTTSICLLIYFILNLYFIFVSLFLFYFLLCFSMFYFIVYSFHLCYCYYVFSSLFNGILFNVSSYLSSIYNPFLVLLQFFISFVFLFFWFPIPFLDLLLVNKVE